MGVVVVLGEAARVEAYALGGALVLAVDDAGAVRRAWDGLPDEVAVAVLTPAAAAALGEEVPGGQGVLRVVMPG